MQAMQRIMKVLNSAVRSDRAPTGSALRLRHATFASLLVAAAVGGGCAAERDPIDRTQGNRVDKHFFLGENLEDFKDDPEFRMKSFNIDSAVNAENFAGTIGGASAVDRVRWEVQEDLLIARRSYQEAPGADNKGLPRKFANGKWEFPDKATGTIIAAYRILSHFDVRRDFNPSTGEENNVIVENTSDRKWYQREFMRVDWSQNLADSTSGDTSWVFGGGSPATAIKYAPTAETDEDRPYLNETDKGYFDITNLYQLKVEANGRWGVPECVIVGFFNGGSTFDCTPPQVKMRTSFQRLTGDEDFESFEENFAQRDVIGNWGNAGNTFNREYGAPPTTTWDPQYGYTDAKTRTFFSHHNIWEKSHWDKSCTSNEDADGNGTADQCKDYKGAKGSQCDTVINRCTIPVRDRQVKTMGWWLNKETPVEFTDEVKDGKKVSTGPIEEMTVTWNTLFKVAVAYRREVECRRTGDGDRASCHSKYFEMDGDRKRTQMVAFGGWGTDTPKELDVDKKRPLVTTCHNPVRAYDPETCGKAGDAIRLGDVRKNFIIYWPFASRAPYGGVATIGADPVTGEMVGASATIMGRSVTAAAAQVRDIIQLNTGDVKIEDLIEGSQPGLYADRVKDGKVQGPGSMSKAKTPEEIKSAINNIDQASLAKVFAGTKYGPSDALTVNDAAKWKLRLNLSPNGPGVAAADAKYGALLAKAAVDSTYLEYNANRPVNRMLAQMRQNKVDSTPGGAAALDAIQHFSSMDSNQVNKIYEEYMAFLGNRGICFHDSQMAASTGSIYLSSLAKYFGDKFTAGDAKEKGVQIYKDLIGEIIKGIGFHEIGHAIGMRHNFASSWDALNYAPQYWQLRTKEGTQTAECVNPGDKCMGPRYIDPLDQDEQGLGDESRPAIEYFGNSSTMEYQIERFGETVGAGTYDQHFVKTLYGRVLEMFDQNIVPTGDQVAFQGKLLSQGISDDLVSSGQKTSAHYTKTARLAKNFDPARDCRDATDEEKKAAKWRIVHGKLCAPSPKNHLAYQDVQSGNLTLKVGNRLIPVGNGSHWHGKDYGDASGDDLIRWNYRYGEDYSSGGYLHAKLFDSGGDIYELTQNVIRRFDRTYPWTYFRRLNKEFAWWSIANTVASGTFARLRGYHWNTARDVAGVAPAGPGGKSDLDDDDKVRPSVMANTEMFNFLQRAILMPEPGLYWTGYPGDRTPPRAGALDILDELGAQCTDFNSATAVAQCQKQAVPLAIMDGRYVQIDFDNTRGGSWDYQEFVHHTSFDDEKVLAMKELVDSRPTLSTVSRDNALDNRDMYVSWRSDVPHALDRLVGGVLAEDWEAVAPSLLDDKSIQNFPIYEQDVTKLVRPAKSNIIFPNVGYSQQLGIAIYAMLFSRASTDLTLAQKMRVRYEGDSGPIPPVGQRAAFVDPKTGIRYFAIRFGTETLNGRQIDKGIASRMLDRANELAAAAFETTGVPGPTGELTYVRDANGNVKVKGDVKKVERYVGLLDALRQIGNVFGAGPLGGGGGGDDEE